MAKKLDDMNSKELLALHNELATKPAGPKTFATKTKLLDRIRSLQATQEAAKKVSGAKPKAPKKKAAGTTVGELARALLMDKRGLPCALIAELVNREIEGASCSPGSVRWYAAKMRKDGIDVPQRVEKFAATMDEAESADWLASVKVIKRGGEE